ncbi:hypothetical protein NDU88_004746 [Pleurodeles waltl]|uniref:Uncharacterized protein n=1 Tax=Pleurodeles waltl TaxID=8319 RepID=A0AAV7SJQ6_PLEWA|nr:hypothetical protein NDU88_004746 [Pleurodeles waltl]
MLFTLNRFDETDKVGKHLVWLGRKELESRWVAKIVEPEGETCNSECAQQHYRSFYKARLLHDASQIAHYLVMVVTLVLDVEERDAREADITLPEVTSAIAKLKTSKSPGPNGIPAEF